jgi:WD40 repeat protein/serine/threonine protein kinase
MSAAYQPGGAQRSGSDTEVTLPPPASPNPAAAQTLNAASAGPGPCAVPGYEVLGELGRGGMGVVYKARQVSLNRVVALKMILGGGHAGLDDLARFRAEAEAVAQLQHPGIVQVFEVGEVDGLPYFSLEYVEGGSLDRKLAGTPLPVPEAAHLVEELARAMQAAHARGVVHRDLKPANVLLSAACGLAEPSSTCALRDNPDPAKPQAADMVPKITDFGLAKRQGAESRTQTGAVLGTPSYMAPEQAGGKTSNIGPACDIYALGAILYECLTGRPPFKAATPLDTVLQVVSEEPVPPSRLQPGVPRDLETICLKCLEKEPARRYASAALLADDLRAFAEDRPIAARPVGPLQQAWRWCKRNRAVAALLAVVFLSLVGGAATSTIFGLRAIASAELAEANAEQADAEAQRATENSRRAEANGERAAAGERRAVETLYATGINLAYREWQDSNIYRGRQVLHACPVERRGWEWHYLDALYRGDELSMVGHLSLIIDLAVSPTSERAASVGRDRTTRLWDTRTGLQVASLSPTATCVAFRRDGRRLAGAVQGGVQVWDGDSGRAVFDRFSVESPLVALAYVDGGRRLAGLSTTGEVLFLDPETGEVQERSARRLVFEGVNPLAAGLGQHAVFSPDGRRLTQGGSDARVRVWDTHTGTLVLDEGGHLGVGQAAFSPDGRRLASPGGEGVIRIWDLDTKKSVQELRGHRSNVHAVSFSPDGRRLASASKDTTARVWDLATGECTLVLNGHVGEVLGVCFGPDGKRVFTRGDAQVKAWPASERTFRARVVRDYLRRHGLPAFGQASSREAWTYYGHTGYVVGLALSHDGRRAATGALREAATSEVRLWDLDRHEEVRGLAVPANGQPQLAFSPDDRLLAVGTAGFGRNAPSQLLLFEPASGKQMHAWPGVPCVSARPAFSPDGKHLACAFTVVGGTSQLVVRELPSGREVFTRTFGSGEILLGPCYLDRERLVVGLGGVVRLLDARTGQDRATWRTGDAVLSCVAVSSRGLVAAAARAGAEPPIRLWDARTGRAGHVLSGHVGMILSLAFIPDGSRLLSSASDFTVKLWDPGTGKELLSFRDHRDLTHEVAWSGDGRRLASVGVDGGLAVRERGPVVSCPDTGPWQRLYRDDFQRDTLGDHWEAQDGTRWAVRGGLRGTLEMARGEKASFTRANVRLRGVELPRTVEVRFTGEFSQSLLFTPQLYDPREQRGLTAVVASTVRPMGFSGAALFLISPGKDSYSLIGPHSPLSLKPHTKYRFRIVRADRRLWFFVDDREILVRDVPPLEAPELGLQASWSEQPTGAEVVYTEVEVRAPADAVRQRHLRGLVERHFDQFGVRRVVREAVERETGLSAADRALARGLVDELREDPDRLLAASLAVSARRDAGAAQRRLALQQAEAACDRVLGKPPWTGRLPSQATLFLTAVALARLRAGQVKEAQVELQQAVEMRRREHGAAAVRQVAGLSLAALALGQKEQAATLRLQMHDLCKGASADELGEAEPFLAEVKARVGPAADEAERNAIFRAIRDTEDAGWYGHNLARYMAGRTADYHEEVARAADPGRHDLKLDRATLAKMRAWDFHGPPQRAQRTHYEKFHVERVGDKARVFYEATVQNDAWSWFRTWAVQAEVRKGPQGWQIAFIRAWPVRGKARGRGVVFDDAWWQARDAEADKAPEKDRARILMDDALRPADALALQRQRTAADGASAEDWALRGRAALSAGQPDEASKAFRRAEEIDPEEELHPALTGPVLEMDHGRGVVFSVAYLPSGDLLSGGSDGELRRWDSKGRLVRKAERSLGQILSVAATQDGKRVVTANTRLCFWDPDTLRPRPTEAGHTKAIYRIAFDRDGKRLVSASADHTARTWDAATGTPLVEFRGHTKDVLGAVFSPDGKYVATASHDGTVRLWDAATGKEVRIFKGHSGEVIRVAFAPDGERLATAGANNEVKVWSVATGKTLHTRMTLGPSLVEVVAYSPDGRLLAAAGEGGAVRLWDTRTMRLVRVLRGHTGRVFALAFSPDGKRLAAGAAESTVRVWEVPALP